MKKFLSTLIILLIPASAFAYAMTDTDKTIVESVVQKIGKISPVNQDKILLQLENAYEKAVAWRTKTLIESALRKIVSNGLYRVVKVVDGDTIKVDFHGQIMDIRILGIDTPEKYTTRTGYKECYGDEASAFAEKTLSGQLVKVEIDDSQDFHDKYVRTLAHIFLADGSYYEELSILNGFGFRYVYNKPTKYDNRLMKSEEDAKLGDLGVWRYCDGKREPVKTGDTSPTVTTQSTTATQIMPEQIVAPSVVSGGFSCSVKKSCTQMVSCEEAKFYLNSCGVQSLDRDKDGIPCESLCK